MATVRVVVLNYNGGAVTLRCVEAVLAAGGDGHGLEVVVVDNASTDDVVASLRRDRPSVRVITNDRNEGFARGCNVAMADLHGVDFVALINNDAIVQPGWLGPLVAAAEPSDVGAVCAKLLLNLTARVVQVEAPVVHTVAGRPVGVGLASVSVAGVDVEGLRHDERFHAAPVDGVWWTRTPTASAWWPIACGDDSDDRNDSERALDVTVHLVAPSTSSVTVGDGVGAATWAVGPQGIDAPARLHGVRRIINSVGAELYEGWQGGDRGFLQPDLGQFDEQAEVFAWCGGAVLLKADYLRDVGLFDRSFFLYYEDFELSWRGRARGWRYLYEPTSVVLHEHMYSSGPGSEFHRYWSQRNRRLTLVLHAPARIALRAVVGAVVAAARRREWSALRVLPAVPAALRTRARLRRVRTVPPEDITRWMTTK
jgi:GT2 family glycosyltransferase